MRDELEGRVAVITGAASGFGHEFARVAAARGMRLVLADVDAAGLEAVGAQMRSDGAEVLTRIVDVSQADQVEGLAEAAYGAFGRVNLLFNNAGVAAGGLAWESTLRDWQWVLGVNLWGVIHGVHAFVPRMLAGGEPGHVVNTASVAGILSPPLMGVYNVSKHGVVALSETLFHDLRSVGARLGVSVLCPAFVPTGIHRSERSRPGALRNEAAPTASMLAAQAATEKAVTSGRIGPTEVARLTFQAIAENRFYVVTHPKIMPSVRLRCEDVATLGNPRDPLGLKPEVGNPLRTGRPG